MSLKVLGIETSCDETAAAVVEGHPDGDKRVASSVVLSQLDEHRPYAGVVPEIAARAHIDHLDSLIEQALTEADIRLDELDGIAATAGPGLIGGVMVGLMTAKALAAATDKPLIAVNHLEGHALTVRLTDDDVRFPYLLLLVSGGHTQLLIAEGVGDYRLLGTTIDDAIGEAFDKTAKMLGLPFPGGPAIDRWAQQGDAQRFKFPKPLINREGCDFSLSGLKTAVRREVEKIGGADGLPDADIADVAASFQRTVGDIVMNRIGNALAEFRASHQNVETVPLVVAGGVAANSHLRARLQDLEQDGVRLIAPPLNLCTDNAAMIAWAGLEHLARGEVASLDVSARARWPLAEL